VAQARRSTHSTGAWRGKTLDADAKYVDHIASANTEEGGTKEGDACSSSSQAQAAQEGPHGKASSVATQACEGAGQASIVN
jgi:hypothetical protein